MIEPGSRVTDSEGHDGTVLSIHRAIAPGKPDLAYLSRDIPTQSGVMTDARFVDLEELREE